MWMKTIQQNLKANNLFVNKAIVVAQNHPLWRLMSTFGAMLRYSGAWCKRRRRRRSVMVRSRGNQVAASTCGLTPHLVSYVMTRLNYLSHEAQVCTMYTECYWHDLRMDIWLERYVAAPVVWNTLSLDLRSPHKSRRQFWFKLKTYLFRQAYNNLRTKLSNL